MSGIDFDNLSLSTKQQLAEAWINTSTTDPQKAKVLAHVEGRVKESKDSKKQGWQTFFKHLSEGNNEVIAIYAEPDADKRNAMWKTHHAGNTSLDFTDESQRKAFVEGLTPEARTLLSEELAQAA